MIDRMLIAMIGLDIFIAVVLIFYGLTGFRRGGIKSFLSLLFLFIAFIITMILFEKPAVYLQVTQETNSSITKVICFSSIFLILVAITRYIYYIVTKIFTKVLLRGTLSGIIGVVFALIEGILLISIVYMNIAFYPVKPPLSDTVSFRMMKDIPVDIRDSALWFLPSMTESFTQDEYIYKEKVKEKEKAKKESEGDYLRR